MKPKKCKWCGDSMVKWRRNVKAWEWNEGHLGKDGDECPTCHRVHMEIPLLFFRCEGCGHEGTQEHFMPGSLYGKEEAVCPLCLCMGKQVGVFVVEDEQVWEEHPALVRLHVNKDNIGMGIINSKAIQGAPGCLRVWAETNG